MAGGELSEGRQESKESVEEDRVGGYDFEEALESALEEEEIFNCRV